MEDEEMGGTWTMVGKRGKAVKPMGLKAAAEKQRARERTQKDNNGARARENSPRSVAGPVSGAKEDAVMQPAEDEEFLLYGGEAAPMEVVETTPETDAIIEALTQSVREQRSPVRQCVCYEDTHEGRELAWGLMQTHEHKTTGGWIHILIPTATESSFEQKMAWSTGAKRCLEGCGDEQYVAEDILITHWIEEAPEVEIIMAAIDKTNNRVKIERLVIGRNQERRNKTAVLLHIPMTENAADIVEMMTQLGGKVASRNDRWKQCNQCNALGHKGGDCPNVMCWHCNQTGHRKKQCKGFIHRILVSATKALPYTVMQMFKAATGASKTYTSSPTHSEHYGEQKSSTFYLEFDNNEDRNQTRALLHKIEGIKTFRDVSEFRTWAKHATDGETRLKASRPSSGRSLTNRSRWGERNGRLGDGGEQDRRADAEDTTETTPIDEDEMKTPNTEDSPYTVDRRGLTPKTSNTAARVVVEETPQIAETETSHIVAHAAVEETPAEVQKTESTPRKGTNKSAQTEEGPKRVATSKNGGKETHTETPNGPLEEEQKYDHNKEIEAALERPWGEGGVYYMGDKRALETRPEPQADQAEEQEDHDPEEEEKYGHVEEEEPDPEEEKKYGHEGEEEPDPEEGEEYGHEEESYSTDEDVAAVIEVADRKMEDKQNPATQTGNEPPVKNTKRTRDLSTPPRAVKQRRTGEYEEQHDGCPESPEVVRKQKQKQGKQDQHQQRTIQDCWQ